MATVTLQTDNKLGLALLAVVVIGVFAYLVATGQLQIGAIAPVSGTATVDLTLSFSDYYSAYRDEDLPGSADVIVVQSDDDVALAKTLNLATDKSVAVEVLVDVARPRVYLMVSPASEEATVGGTAVKKEWWVVYPPIVNTEAPTYKAGYKVYPADLSGLGLKPNEVVSYTMPIQLALTTNVTKLTLPSEVNVTIGSAPVSVSISGLLEPVINYTMYRGVKVSIAVSDGNLTVRGFTLGGASYSVKEVSDTEYEVDVGTLELLDEGKSVVLDLEAEQLGSYTVTVTVTADMPDGSTATLASGSVTVNVS